MKRRAFLRSAPALAFLPSIAVVPALAESETPVMSMFRKWRLHYNWLNSDATRDMPEGAFDAETEAGRAIVRDMIELPARDMQDVLAKLMALTEWGGDLSSYGIENCSLIAPEALVLFGEAA